MSETVKTHEQIVHDLMLHLEFFAICPCCGTKPLEYKLIPRARMVLFELSCYGCSFTGQVKVHK